MRNSAMTFLIALACLCLTHCATTQAPKGWLNDPNDVPKDVYGGWVDVTSREGILSGELIAAGPDSVYVADAEFHSVAVSDVLRMRVTVYNSGGAIAQGTLGGTLLALSNGWIFLGTGPMWIIGGTIAAITRSYDPAYDFPSSDLKTFAMFARFPQGLPASIDRSLIKAKRPK